MVKKAHWQWWRVMSSHPSWSRGENGVAVCGMAHEDLRGDKMELKGLQTNGGSQWIPHAQQNGDGTRLAKAWYEHDQLCRRI